MRKCFILFIFPLILKAQACGVGQEPAISGVNSVSPTESSIASMPPTAISTAAPIEKDLKAEIVGQQKANDFSVFLDDKYITLRDWDTDNYVTNILGKPNKESVEVLGAGSDTFEGSSIKTLEYEGLTVKLFLGKETYWVMRIEITSKKYKTLRGISVGMSVDDLKTKYDNVNQVLDGRTDVNNCGYTINNSENYIWFEVEKGVIKEMKYYLELG